jgi:hypothetical protein
MKRLLFALCLVPLFGSIAFAQSPFPTVVSTRSAAIAISTATTTELVPLVAGQAIAVTSFNVVAGGTGNFQLVYGTGTACATGATAVTGNYNLIAQAGLAIGSGVAPILILPPGKALCATTSAAVDMSGSISYAQF